MWIWRCGGRVEEKTQMLKTALCGRACQTNKQTVKPGEGQESKQQGMQQAKQSCQCPRLPSPFHSHIATSTAKPPVHLLQRVQCVVELQRLRNRRGSFRPEAVVIEAVHSTEKGREPKQQATQQHTNHRQRSHTNIHPNTHTQSSEQRILTPACAVYC